LRQDYFSRLTGSLLNEDAILSAAKRADGFSFAQVREAYVSAGQCAFQRGDEAILLSDLIEGIAAVRNGANGSGGRLGERGTGFTALMSDGHV
jgi:hypothetical protein